MATPMTIWDDPRVQAALQERPANDIAILECPTCRTLGYYNQGSHFTCLPCDVTYYCCGETEDAPIDGQPYLILDQVMQLSDVIMETPDIL